MTKWLGNNSCLKFSSVSVYLYIKLFLKIPYGIRVKKKKSVVLNQKRRLNLFSAYMTLLLLSNPSIFSAILTWKPQPTVRALRSWVFHLSTLPSLCPCVPVKNHLIRLWNATHVLFACAPPPPPTPTTAQAVTLAKISAAFGSITDAAHAVAMEMATLKGCREAFVLINGCKKRRDTRGRRSVTDVQ